MDKTIIIPVCECINLNDSPLAVCHTLGCGNHASLTSQDWCAPGRGRGRCHLTVERSRNLQEERHVLDRMTHQHQSQRRIPLLHQRAQYVHSTWIPVTEQMKLLIKVRDRSIFIGDLGLVHFKFSVWKKSMSYFKRKQTKITILSLLKLKKVQIQWLFWQKKVCVLSPFTPVPTSNPPIGLLTSPLVEIVKFS